MDFTLQITEAEEKYQNLLEDFLIDVFRKASIDSHGPDHHRRVWQYAKELLSYPGINNTLTDVTLPEKLIMACYLHDSGISVDHGPRHGSHSMEFFKIFLNKYKIEIRGLQDIMSAIENHDNKEYHQGRKESDLDTILSVADDMDAFGYTGIYRYLEIYLLRNIPLDSIGLKIKANVTHRFNNLLNNYGSVPDLIRAQRGRYETVTSFCDDMIREIPLYQSYSVTGHYKGACGIAEIIGKVARDEIALDDIGNSNSKINVEENVRLFFSKLNNELKRT
jgi:HD superfamily phosphodiesterase